jgi:hypothetical protein
LRIDMPMMPIAALMRAGLARCHYPVHEPIDPDFRR